MKKADGLASSSRLVLSPGIAELLELQRLYSLTPDQVQRATFLARQLGTVVVLRRVDFDARTATRIDLQTGDVLGVENL